MAQGNRPNPNKLTVEELRLFQGNENLSDEELERQSNFLLDMSIILYRLYQKETTETPVIDINGESLSFESNTSQPVKKIINH